MGANILLGGVNLEEYLEPTKALLLSHGIVMQDSDNDGEPTEQELESTISTLATNRYNAGRSQGRSDVTSSPNSYSLYTSAQYNSYGTSRYNAGVAAGKATLPQHYIKINTANGSFEIPYAYICEADLYRQVASSALHPNLSIADQSGSADHSSYSNLFVEGSGVAVIKHAMESTVVASTINPVQYRYSYNMVDDRYIDPKDYKVPGTEADPIYIVPFNTKFSARAYAYSYCSIYENNYIKITIYGKSVAKAYGTERYYWSTDVCSGWSSRNVAIYP